MQLFKKNHKPKSQRQEEKRREDLIRGLSQLLHENCDSAQEMKTRVEIIDRMVDQKGEDLIKAYKQSLAKDKFSSLGLVAQDGKGKETEQKIMEFFANETLEVAQTLLQQWTIIHDAFVRKLMLESKPADLKIHFKE